MERWCRDQGVGFRFGVDPRRSPAALAGSDRIGIATGAAHPVGWGRVARFLLRSGLPQQRALKSLLSQKRLREWLYYRGRRPTR
jgi:hypothetical protein